MLRYLRCCIGLDEKNERMGGGQKDKNIQQAGFPDGHPL
jgi:hypothetical protein